MTTSPTPAREVLEKACSIAGFDPRDAKPIRVAENEIWQLSNRVIVRIARTGQWEAAAREVRVAQWLADNQVPAVRTLEVDQPVEADDRPVTFWEELRRHETGSVMDVVTLLKQLHALPVPDLQLGRLDPFVRVAERIDAATSLSDDDRGWLHQQLVELKTRWQNPPEGLPECVVHGDAWVGNAVRTAAGPILLDLERVSVGPPEWDLVSTAVKMTTTGAVSKEEYAEFCTAYGTDVTRWEGYELLARARQLRMTSYAAQHAASRPEWRAEAQYRVDCLRGRTTPPPWEWMGIM